jgi:hypothetical protein
MAAIDAFVGGLVLRAALAAHPRDGLGEAEETFEHDSPWLALTEMIGL